MSTLTVAPSATAWGTFYVYLHRPAPEVNRFLLEVVGPRVRALVADGHATGWHFLRYWAGGPHLRVRVRDASPATLAELAAYLCDAAAAPAERVELDGKAFYARFRGPGSDEWHADGQVLAAQYEPETDRYGGEQALHLCEDFFEASSELALDVLAAARGEHEVRVVGVDFVLLAMARLTGAAVTDGSDAARMLSARRYFAGWDYSPEAVTDAGHARRAAETIYWATPSAWDGRAAAVEAVAAQGGGSTHAAWADALDRLMTDLHAIGAAGDLRNDPDRIVWSLVHMMNNRLGLGVVEERVATWLATLCSPAWRRSPDFFADGVGAADRSYLENSKYRHGEIEAGQRPRPADPRPPAYPAEFVPAAPVPPLTTSLADTLALRESGYGDYGGRTTADRIGALLGAATGLAPGRRRTFGPTTVQYRTYPSASGAHAVDIFLLARAVDGLEPGAYHYDARRHGFERVDRQSDEGTFPLLSPVLGELGVGAALIDASSVPAVLVLTGDLDRLRARYGLRALRLALLEAGHVAQNLGLVAAALGLRSVHLSAFVDDELSSRLHLDGYSRVALAVLPVGEPRGPALPYDPTTTERNHP